MANDANGVSQIFNLERECRMKAAVYEGPGKVVVEDMHDSRIEKPTDVLVKVTATHS
ncbi:hypothetical protein SAMN05192539_1010182 [Paraburkholderia diazotrophica]|uniref:Uncharacterized protein n=2 Tax=Paraburkholderia diazotrophica TaxID=667676 RepID=A0A1H6YKJ5_9BURK|nr:hypothetical protein SAMN05192539_1010182 [Paraburkholderia diazotrophica]